MNPDTSLFGQLRNVIDYDKAEQEFQLKKQLLQNKVGGQDPAPLKLANEYLSAVERGDTARANAIREFAKTQDKGLGLMGFQNGQPVFGTLPGYAQSVGAIEGTKAGYKQQAEKDVDLQMLPPIEYNKTLAGQQAKTKAERGAGFTKAQSALVGFKQQSDLVTSTIDKALDTIEKSKVPMLGSTATGYASFAPLPNTRARELRNYLDTIRANVGFDKLQNMRENSPTGGALGQVSEMENKLLQAVNGALDPAQEDQLVDNLKVIKNLYPQVLAERQRAFQQDYGEFGDVPQNVQITPDTAPAPQIKFLGFE